MLRRHAVAVEVKDSGYRLSGRTMQTSSRRPGVIDELKSKDQVDGLTVEPEEVELSTTIDVKFQAV